MSCDSAKWEVIPILTNKNTQMEKLTLRQVENILMLSQYIYVKHITDIEWELFLDNDGNPFEYLSDAIRYFRNSEFSGSWGYQLSTYQQARMGNAEWDNF